MAAAGSAGRYAKAIFGLAQDEGTVERWRRQLVAVSDLFDQPDLRQVVDNPTITPERRLHAVEEVATPEMGQEGLNLGRLLVESRQAGLAADILEAFEGLVDESEGRVRATATTAIPLDDDELTQLRRHLSSRLGKDVRLELRVEPAIVGGLVLQVGDRQVDASVSTRLQQLRQRLVSA